MNHVFLLVQYLCTPVDKIKKSVVQCRQKGKTMSLQTISEYSIRVYNGGYGTEPYICHDFKEFRYFVGYDFRNHGGHFPCTMSVLRNDKIFDVGTRKLKHYPHWASNSNSDFWYYNYTPIKIERRGEQMDFIAMDEMLNLGNLQEYILERGNFGNFCKLIKIHPDINAGPVDIKKPISFTFYEHWETELPGLIWRPVRWVDWRFLDAEKDVVVNVKTLEQIYGQKKLDFNIFFENTKADNY